MNKSELLKLKEKLLKSETYCLVDIFGNEDGYINLELIDNTKLLKENIEGAHREDSEDVAVRYFEKACENFIRTMATNNISYDQIEVDISPLFYIKSSAIDQKATEEGDILESDFQAHDLLDDMIVTNFAFCALENGKRVETDSINHYTDKLLTPQFTLKYSTFVDKMSNKDFDLDTISFKDVVESRKNGKSLKITIDFTNKKQL
ncbi:MAG: hypothetical protein IKO49_04530 [Bacilli bacterium]|nr:hypothetical protein [Bacilli bacterium]